MYFCPTCNADYLDKADYERFHTCPKEIKGKHEITTEQQEFITKVSESKVYQGIVQMLLQQSFKGFNKYGHTLDNCPDDKYDWRLMAMEELIDLAQYQQKEIMRLERLLNP